MLSKYSNSTLFINHKSSIHFRFNVDCSETEDLYAGNAIIGDENARIGGDTASSNKGQGRQSGERRNSNNNNSRKPSKSANSNTQRSRPASKKPSAPAKEPAKNKSQPKANTPRRKPSNTNGNGRKKKPGVRKIKKKKGKTYIQSFIYFRIFILIFLCFLMQKMIKSFYLY